MSEKVATLTNPAVRVINEDDDAFFGITFPLTYKSGNVGFFPRSSTVFRTFSRFIYVMLDDYINISSESCKLQFLQVFAKSGSGPRRPKV